ncbi:NAD(P)/FAD-dependent oxidoreductase, partial [Psychrobacter sp. 1U2]|uniref:NAD(P)/FAD-dependent oxidoreductase n=1 Tax=Psychrobacter sp. 1U2 TaxID=3453577 RepID=UPI003F471875
MDNNTHYDVIIVGAGASGLYCALTAGRRGRRVLVLDHANKVGKKILMSGGGRCNFTNYFVEPEHFISRYPSWEFIGMVEQHKIPYHEREHGQLFCDDSAQDIVTMLLDECAAVGVQIRINTQIDKIDVNETEYKRFNLSTSKKLSKKDIANSVKPSQHKYSCDSLVVATGGLSIPTMGASGLGYELAQQFGHQLM